MEMREIVPKQGERARRSGWAVVLLMVGVVAMLLGVGPAANATASASLAAVASSRQHSPDKADRGPNTSAGLDCFGSPSDTRATAFHYVMSSGDDECENILELSGNNDASFTRGTGWQRSARFDEWIDLNDGRYPYYIDVIVPNQFGNPGRTYRFTQPQVTKVEYAGEAQRVTFHFDSIAFP